MTRSTVGILMLVPSGWGEIWTGRHHIAARLARRHPLVWMTPAEPWREVFSKGLVGQKCSPAAGAPDVLVYDPPSYLPHVYRPGWLRDRLFRRRLAQARARLVEAGARRIVLYVWRPHFDAALDLVPHDLSIYHVNDEYSFSATAEGVTKREARLLRQVDQVIIHSPELMRRKGNLNPRTIMLPNGVDYAAFNEPRPIPADLARVPTPRIGYVGWLKRHLDWPMLESLVAARPALSFVFVGPTSPHPELDAVIARLSARPNVHFLGGKPAASLPDYVQHLDVCLLPYLDNSYTRCIYPLKLHESLAAGKPVVATSLPSIEPFGSVVQVVHEGESWPAAVDAASGGAATSDTNAEARRAVARAHDWGALTERIETLLRERLPE